MREREDREYERKKKVNQAKTNSDGAELTDIHCDDMICYYYLPYQQRTISIKTIEFWQVF